MPGIGSLIGEKAVKMSDILESKTDFRSVKPMSEFKGLRNGTRHNRRQEREVFLGCCRCGTCRVKDVIALVIGVLGF